MFLYEDLATSADDIEVLDLNPRLVALKKSPKARILASVAYKGHNAHGGVSLKIYADGYQIAEIFNDDTDELVHKHCMKPCNAFIPPNSQLSIKTNGAITTGAHMGIYIVTPRN